MITRELIQWVEAGTLTQRDLQQLLEISLRDEDHPDQDIKKAVNVLLRNQMTLMETSLEVISRQCCVSGRTLNRKLSENGTTFKQLLNNERKRRLIQLFHDGQTNAEQISAHLGFSDVNYFYRVFKNWTGLSFGECKENMAGNHRDIGAFLRID